MQNKIPTMDTLLIKFRPQLSNNFSKQKRFLIHCAEFLFLSLKNRQYQQNQSLPHYCCTIPGCHSHILCPEICDSSQGTPLRVPHPQTQKMVPALLSNLNLVTDFLICKMNRYLLWSHSALKSCMPKEDLPQKTLPSPFLRYNR